MEKAWNHYEDLIELCLRAIKQGGASVEDCLARYPDQRSELEPLLRTAVQLDKARSLQASAQFKAGALRKLRAATEANSRSRKSWWSFLTLRNFQAPFKLQKRAAYLLVGLFLVIFISVGVGTVVASNHSLPGDFLYPVKRTQENLQLKLAFNVFEQADLHLEFAERRIVEAGALVNQDRTRLLSQTLADYDRHMQTELAFISGGSKLTPVQQSDLAAKLLHEVNRYQANLTAMIPNTPSSVKNSLEAALVTSRKTYNQAVEVINNQNGVNSPTPFFVLTPTSTPVPPTKPAVATRIPTRSLPSSTATPSRPPSIRNNQSTPTAAPPTTTPPASIRPSTTLPTSKETPTVTSRTPSTNSASTPTATRPSTDSNLKPTATSSKIPEPGSIAGTSAVSTY